ncbi:MmyB family transcriptional regulator [Kitasatospora sp. NPDC001159]
MDNPGIGSGLHDDPAQSLSELLRSWRARVDPRRIPGLVREGRRGSGLSQMDVAWLTGVTDRWYRELELGRQANFSPDFLDRLALALRLSEAEREVLYLRTVGHPPRQRPAVDAEAVKILDEGMQQLLDNQLPNPAYLSDEAWNVFGHNQPQIEWFPWIPYEPNVMKWAFLYPEARVQLVRWAEDWAGPMLAQLRYACLQNPEKADLQQVAREILQGSPEAREMWEHAELIHHPDGDIRRLRLPYHGEQEIAVRMMVLAPLRRTTVRLMILMRMD